MENEAYYNEVETLEFQPSCNYRESNKVAPEIIEIEEEENNDEYKENKIEDVYVAVGKDDLQLLKWVLANIVAPGVRVNLIHVSPPISSISTPVGRLWVGPLSPEQAKIYATEEHNKRKNLLHKYIRLCLDNKVNVDTLLIESNETTKAILDLIPVLNMTSLVMGAKHPTSSRRLIKGPSKGTFIHNNAPSYCKVTLVYVGKKNVDNQEKMYHISPSFITSNEKQVKPTRQKYERNNMECACFPVKFY